MNRSVERRTALRVFGRGSADVFAHAFALALALILALPVCVAGLSPARAADPPLRAALFGDSNSAFVFQSGDSRKLSNFGYFNWINRVLGAPFEIAFNAGIAGNDTQQMRSRYADGILARSDQYDVLFLQGGVNDIRHGLSPAQAAENLVFFTQDQIGRGKRVVLVLPQPVDFTNPAVSQGVAQSPDQAREGYGELRRRLLAWAGQARNDKLVVLDPFPLLVRKDSRGAEMDLKWSPDQIHFAAPAGLKFAEAVKDSLAARLLNRGTAFVAHRSDRPNRIANPDFSGGQPDRNGNVLPAPFAVTVNGGANLAGSIQVATEASPAGTALVIAPLSRLQGVRNTIIGVQQSVPLDAPAGRRVRAGVRLDLRDVVGLTSIGLKVSTAGDGAPESYDGWTGWDTLPLEPRSSSVLQLLTPWLDVGGTTSRVTWSFQLRWKGDGDAPAGAVALTHPVVEVGE